MTLLNAIVRFALRFRGVMISLMTLLVVYGVYTLIHAKYDVFPEFTPPQVVINTEAPGLSPKQVELLVTQPIENAVNGVPGVKSVFSDSIQGISAVTINFVPGGDIYRDRQLISERLSVLAPELPSGSKPPTITPLLSSTGNLAIIGLTSDKRSLMDLRTLADWTIKPHLLAVPGVASIPIFGGDVRQLQIQVKPAALVRYGLSVGDVLKAAREATGIEGAGFVETENQRLILQTKGQIADPALLAKTVIRSRNGVAVTLGDVATVTDAAAPHVGSADILGKPGVLVKVNIQYGANTLAVSRRVNAALAELRPLLRKEGVTMRTDLFQASDFIRLAVHNVRTSLLLGAILVACVLLLFLADFRTAAISCVAIPVSLLTAIVILQKLGLTLNTMTMGGLAIAIGEVVDDAVIDVENILRRIRENHRRRDRKPVFEVVLKASMEVRGAVVFATFSVILVFLPVMTLSGLAGRLFAPLGMAYLLAIVASLAVALTLTPALCLALLRHYQTEEKAPWLVRILRKHYRRLLAKIERHGRWVVAAAAVVSLGGLCLFPFIQKDFLPALNETQLVLHVQMVPGTSLEATQRFCERVEKALLKLPEVKTIADQVGRATFDDVRGPSGSELPLTIKLSPGEDVTEAENRIRAVLNGFAGATFGLNSFLTERVNETLSGYTAPVVVNLYSKNLDQLAKVAPRLGRLLAGIPGATDVQLQAPPGAPQLEIALRPHELLRWGLTPVQVMDAVRVAFQGETVSQIHEGNSSYDVSVVLDPKLRHRVSDVGSLPIRSPSGRYLLLRQLADISVRMGRSDIPHEAARRVQTVTCNVTGRSVTSFVGEARRVVDSRLALPPGMVVEFAGSAAAEAQARRELILHSLMAGVGIILLLAVVLRHRNHVLLVLVNLPFALAGGILAASIFGDEISLGSMVGFVTVFGITLRNSIMLLSHYEHLVTVEGHPWGLRTCFQGAVERLAPILMTALVTALGLLPLALGQHAPGREIEGPMSMVILGGLVTSTSLNLLVLPTLALRYGRFGQRTNGEQVEAT